MAKMKRYTCERFPFYGILIKPPIRFVNGVFSTDNPVQQKAIESHNYYGHIIKPAVAPPEPAPRPLDKATPTVDAVAYLDEHGIQLEDAIDAAIGKGVIEEGQPLTLAAVEELFDEATPAPQPGENDEAAAQFTASASAMEELERAGVTLNAAAEHAGLKPGDNLTVRQAKAAAQALKK